MAKAPTQLIRVVDEALVALVDVGPKLRGLAAHLRQMDLAERADALEVSAGEIGTGVQKLNYYLKAKGGDLRDVASAILGIRDSFQAKFFPFADLAGYLRSVGLDSHAAVLEQFTVEMLRMTHTIHVHAEAHGMLDDTLSMNLGELTRGK